jgi:hypothetical protein
MTESAEVETTQGPGSTATTSSTVWILSRSGIGQDASQLGQCAFGGRRKGRQAEVTQSAKPQRKCKCLLVGEQQRRETKTGPQAIPSADSARGFNGNAEVLEAKDVALNSTKVYFQALGEIGSGDMVASLENLEDGEDAHDGVVHRNSIIHQNYHRGCRESCLV